MFIFILESIGTSELILIGIIALVFLGPRKLPEIARKIGKVLADFRNTTNEFKSTWEREVDFEEETKALKMESIDREIDKPVARENSILKSETEIETPSIKEIDKLSFDAIAAQGSQNDNGDGGETEISVEPADKLVDKRNWL